MPNGHGLLPLYLFFKKLQLTATAVHQNSDIYYLTDQGTSYHSNTTHTLINPD